MKPELSPHNVVVLGGTSKVWRLTHPFWYQCSQGLIHTTRVARRSFPGIDELVSDASDVRFLPQCKAVISFMGITAGSPDELRRNTDLALQAEAIACQLGASLLVHASTGAVYKPTEGLITETSDVAPRADYGVSKLAAERAIGSRVKVVHLRLGNFAGADSLFRAFTHQDTIPMDTFADGSTPARSYIAPDDLARVLLMLLNTNPDDLPTHLNVAGPRPVEMGAIAQAAGKALENKPAAEGALAIQHLGVGRLEALGFVAEASSDPAHLATFRYPDGAT